MTRRIYITIGVLIAAVAALTLFGVNRGDRGNQEDRGSAPHVFSASSPVVIPLGISVAEAASLPQGMTLAGSGAVVTGPRGERMGDVSLALVQEEGEYRLSFTPENAASFKPGKYHIAADIDTGRGIRRIEQDFLWGVLAVNPNKSVYRPGETAKLAFAVLDEEGMMVCNARVALQIRSPNSEVRNLTTDDKNIIVNKECMMKDVTQKPDYEAEFVVGETGLYQMTLTAVTRNGTWVIEDYFEVKNNIAYDIERTTNTRIYPHKAYPVNITVRFEQGFTGVVEERVPAAFEIYRSIEMPSKWDERVGDSGGMPHTRVRMEGYMKILEWDVSARSGETVKLGYRYDAPDISPEFYLLGPLRLVPTDVGIRSGQAPFEESRQWQVASDAFAFDETITECFTTATSTNAMLGWSPQANDILLLAVVVRIETTAVTSVAGNGLTWTQVADVDDGSANMGVSVFRASSASTPSSGAVTFSHNTNKPALAILTRISGGDRTTSDGVEASNTNAGPATADNDMLVSLTTVTDSALAVGLGGQRGSSAFTPGADETEIFESSADCGLSGDRVRGNLWHITSAVSPAATVELGQINSLAAAQPWVAVGVSLKPATADNSPTISTVTDTPDPTNPNRSVTFITDWAHADSGETVKVKVCKNVISGQNCDGSGFWASSSAFTTSDPESLVYDIVGGDAGQTRSFNVYVCDDDEDCSAANAGTFAVNAVSTVPNIKTRGASGSGPGTVNIR